MKKLLLLSACALLVRMHAQISCDTLRYLSPVFDSVIVHSDVLYGEAQVWNIPYNNTDLFMDVYEPFGDTLSKRPLMIWVHPGGFLNGDKSADDMVALCDSFARRGYVTASINYRLGFNPLSAESAERAVYRGTQDLRAAIRYLKEFASDYQIDTNYTFIGGSSAGGFSAIHTVYLDEDEAPSSIEGSWASPDLGCLDCDGNDYQHLMNISGYVSLWGAIGDSSWIDSDETTPGLLVHGTGDGTVPYDVGHPFGVPTTPETQGSRCVHNQLSALAIPHSTYFVDGEPHEFHGADNGTFNSPPNAYWDTIFMLVRDHYHTILQPAPITINGSDLVCEGRVSVYHFNGISQAYCVSVENGQVLSQAGDSIEVLWDNAGTGSLSVINYSNVYCASETNKKTILINALPDAAFSTSISGSSVTFVPNTVYPGATYTWNFGDGNIYTSSDGTENVAHAYADGNWIAELTITSSAGCSNTYSSPVNVTTASIAETDFTELRLYPNPVGSQLHVSGLKPGQSWQLSDLQGNVIREGNSETIAFDGISAGAYLLIVRNPDGYHRIYRVVHR